MLCIVSLTIGLAAGFGAPKDAVKQEPAVPVGQMGKRHVLPDTRISLELRFESCGHSVYRSLDKPEWIGLTKSEIAELNSGDSIAAFSSEMVCLLRLIPGNCGAHLRLGIHENGQLCVERRNEETLKNETVLLLPTEVDDMEERIRTLLENGLIFDSLDEINAYLESAES